MMRYTPPLQRSASGAVEARTYVWTSNTQMPWHRLGDAGLSVLAALGVACLVATIAATLVGVRPLVVRSGSMAPAMPVGSLVLARTVPADDLSPGEVVSVRLADGARVTHRLVASEPHGALHRLTLKGDANDAPDAEPVTLARADRVFLSVPALGGWLRAATAPPLHFLAGLATGGALLWAFGPPTARAVGGWIPEERTPRGARS